MPTLTPALLDHIREVLLHCAAAFAIFLVFWLVAVIIGRLIRRFGPRTPGNVDLFELLGRVAKMSFLVFGVITAMGTAGVNVSALVAGLGLTGFALGFAFRDILSNLLSGVLLLLYRPFVRGDRISVSGFEGTVAQIDLRYTVLDSEGKTVLIPNSNLFTNPIVVEPADSPASLNASAPAAGAPHL